MKRDIFSALWCGLTTYLASYPVATFLGWVIEGARTITGDKLPPTPLDEPFIFLPLVIISALYGPYLGRHLRECERLHEVVMFSVKVVLVASMIGAPLTVLWEDYGFPTFSWGRFFLLVPIISIVGTLLTSWITLPIGVCSLLALYHVQKKISCKDR